MTAMLPWIIFVLLVAILLAIGVERLMKRLGIVPEEDKPAGFQDVLAAWHRWLEERRR